MTYIVYYDVTMYQVFETENPAELAELLNDKSIEVTKMAKDKGFSTYSFVLRPEPVSQNRQILQTPPPPDED